MRVEAIGDDLTGTEQDGEKRSRSLKPLGRLTPYIKRYRIMVAGALVSLALAAISSLALPQAIRRMVDHGFTHPDGIFIDSYFGMLMVVAVVLAAASASRYYFVTTLGERIVSDLRRDVFSHVIRLPPSFFDVNHSGELVSRLTADTTQIKSAVGATASVALRNLILCFGGIGMMVVTSPKLSGLALGAIPLIVFPLVAFGRSVRKRSRAAQDTLAKASAFASELTAATRTVQAFNGEDAAASSYGRSVEAAYKVTRSAIRSRAFLTGIAITLIFGSVVGVLWVGAHNVLAGTMTPGALSQFLLYSVIAAGSLGSLSEVWGELSQAAGAAERLTELLDEVSPIGVPAQPESLPFPARGRVVFNNVRFAYPSCLSKPALHDLAFEVAPGETVAIVGPSGAGKSTVLSLLLRFYDPQLGSIEIDGVDARKVSPGALREQVAIVPQDVTIFATSIHENIAFGRPHATRDEVRAAAMAARADEFILRLERGYDTHAGERGVTLSGGQRQRIAIARAILKDAPILLLDEATSSLDAESETLVQRALDELMEGRTTIIVAHRLATVLRADRILVMDQGRVVEEGTHHSLIRHGGIYARLAKLQFDAGAEELQTAG